MDWYQYTYRRGSISRQIVRPMTAAQAAELGAVPVDPDAARKIAGVLVCDSSPECSHEASFESVTAERAPTQL